MLHAITKRLEICIDINTEISEVHHYTWIFTSRIFRLGNGLGVVKSGRGGWCENFLKKKNLDNLNTEHHLSVFGGTALL